jgi:hypothetical protein
MTIILIIIAPSALLTRLINNLLAFNYNLLLNVNEEPSIIKTLIKLFKYEEKKMRLSHV